MAVIGFKPRFVWFLNLATLPTRNATGEFPTISHYSALGICINTFTDILFLILFLALSFFLTLVTSLISSTIYFYTIVINVFLVNCLKSFWIYILLRHKEKVTEKPFWNPVIITLYFRWLGLSHYLLLLHFQVYVLVYTCFRHEITEESFLF